MLLWLVMNAQRFDAAEYDAHPIGMTGRIKTTEEPHWYAPLFESRETALEWADGEAQVFAVEVGTPRGGGRGRPSRT